MNDSVLELLLGDGECYGEERSQVKQTQPKAQMAKVYPHRRLESLVNQNYRRVNRSFICLIDMAICLRCSKNYRYKRSHLLIPSNR